MKSIRNSMFVALLFGSIVSPAHADTNMDEKQTSKYLGVISCVDRTFFDGGYDVGDQVRESLMTEFLTKHNMPKYNEELYAKESEIKKDTASYMEGYMICDSDSEYLTKIAQSHNITSEEY